MNVYDTPLPGLVLVQPKVFSDDRGLFMETWRQETYEPIGVRGPFVQDNFSSSKRGTLRGLHYQLRRPQGKLVHVTRGQVFDVAVDVRSGSPTFKSWFGIVLSEKNHVQLYLPEGFAHGFLVLSEVADFSYKCTAPYVADDDRSVRWDDPAIGIEWPLTGLGPPLLSPRDAAAPLLADAELPGYTEP